MGETTTAPDKPATAPRVERYITLAEVAEIAGIHHTKVMQWVAEGWLPKPMNMNAAKDYRWNPEALRRWKVEK